MRPIALIIFFALTSFSSFAQRLNEHGLKMVSEIEFSDKRGGGSCYLMFKYDEKDRLTRMSVYRGGKLYRDFIKDNRGLYVKDYDDYNYSPLRWEISFDCYGNINRICVFEEFSPGSIRKDEFNFGYERDGIDDTYRLGRYSYTETGKHKGEKSWFGTSVGTLYGNFYHKEGFIVEGDGENLGRTYTIDYNHINDSNINLLYFFGRSSLYGGGMNMSYFTLTEWLPCRSKYFIDESVNWKEDEDVLQYLYKYDDNGNLMEVERIFLDYLDWELVIKYLY